MARSLDLSIEASCATSATAQICSRGKTGNQWRTVVHLECSALQCFQLLVGKFLSFGCKGHNLVLPTRWTLAGSSAREVLGA